ncbi:hypothetical protein SAMN04488113_1349 [Alkalibacterium gilvum]|uniref:Uncharacterized protein n=1 Tax=Alkalibacterium gilvum TaxID=1130080 RepID=A0A1H6UKQ7_9LACT|nr:hypothetical protein [Alkalibacterium gilvum]SEI92891.1 hypothetical protein SAMN04488113_1349 [Alkalibacterium gilvum]
MTLYIVYHISEDRVLLTTSKGKKAMALVGDVALKDVSVEEQLRIIEIDGVTREKDCEETLKWKWYGEDNKVYEFYVDEEATPDITDVVLYRNNLFVPFASNSLIGTIDIRRIDAGKAFTGVETKHVAVVKDLEVTEVK